MIYPTMMPMLRGRMQGMMNVFGAQPMQNATMTALAYPMMMQPQRKKRLGGANNIFGANLGASPAAPLTPGGMKGF